MVVPKSKSLNPLCPCEAMTRRSGVTSRAASTISLRGRPAVADHHFHIHALLTQSPFNFCQVGLSFRNLRGGGERAEHLAGDAFFHVQQNYFSVMHARNGESAVNRFLVGFAVVKRHQDARIGCAAQDRERFLLQVDRNVLGRRCDAPAFLDPGPAHHSRKQSAEQPSRPKFRRPGPGFDTCRLWSAIRSFDPTAATCSARG